MSSPEFQPYYNDGQTVMVGDRILNAGRETVMTGVFADAAVFFGRSTAGSSRRYRLSCEPARQG